MLAHALDVVVGRGPYLIGACQEILDEYLKIEGKESFSVDADHRDISRARSDCDLVGGALFCDLSRPPTGFRCMPL